MKYSIREISPNGWEAFRHIRLEALSQNPGVFFSSHEKEAGFTPDEWRGRLGPPTDKCVFGLYYGEELCGITGIVTSLDDPSGETAMIVSVYIHPTHRGKNLTKYLYHACLNWAKAHPRLKNVLVGHRANNDISKRTILAQGFRYLKSVPLTWPDGAAMDDVKYEMKTTEIPDNLAAL